MADSKLSQLTALAGTALAAGDLFYVDDVSAGTAGSKSIRADLLLDGIMRVSSGPMIYDGSGNTALFGSLNATANLSVGAGADVRAGEYAAFTVTNPTIRWPNTSPDAQVDRGAAKVVRISDGASGGAALSSPALTPAQITSNQNNYSPGAALFTRLSSDASRDVTGLVAGVDGETRFLWNVGSADVVLKNQSGSSTGVNRFLTSTGADLTLAVNKCAIAQYDGTNQRWRTTLLP